MDIDGLRVKFAAQDARAKLASRLRGDVRCWPKDIRPLFAKARFDGARLIGDGVALEVQGTRVELVHLT